MTSAIQKQDVTTLRAIGPDEGGWTRERIDLIKKTVCPGGISDNEFALFVEQCKRSGLDPLIKEAYCVKRGSMTDKGWVEKFEFQPAIGGMLARAERFPDYEGIRSAAVYPGDVVEIDNATGNITHKTDPTKRNGKAPIGAWAVVHRHGKAFPVSWVDFAAYVQTKKDGSPTKFWATMPATMIEKVARAAALRLAFPSAFGGLYISEEMKDDAGEEAAPLPRASVSVAPPPPAPERKALNAPAQTTKIEDAEVVEQARRDAGAITSNDLNGKPPAPVPTPPTKQEQALDAVAAAKSAKDLAEAVNLITGLRLSDAEAAVVRKAYNEKMKAVRGGK